MTLLMIFSVVLCGRVSEWDHYTHFGGVNDMLITDGHVMAATTGGVAFGSTGNGGVTWDSTWTCPGELSRSDARCLALDSSGNIWVGTYGGGLDVKLSSGGFQHYGQLEGLPISLEINCIIPDTTVWVGTNSGLCGKELGYFTCWTEFSTGGGLPSNIITCIAKSDSGLFVGTSSGMVMLKSGSPPGVPGSWLAYPKLQAASIQDILVDGDTAWAATTENLYFLVGGTGTWTEMTSYTGGTPVSLASSENGLAVGGIGNAAVYSNSVWTFSTAGLEGQIVQDIDWLSADSLIIGLNDQYSTNRASGNGIAVGIPGSWSSSCPEGTPSNNLYSVDLDSRNDVWVTSNRSGAAVLSNGSWTGFVSELSDKNQVYACAADNSGGVFIAPYHFGVDWLDWKGTPDKSDDVIISFDKSNSGLLNDQIMDISVSRSGVVWFAQETFWQTPGEPSGVCRLSWTSGQETTASWKTFQPSSGLPSGEVRAVQAGTSSSRVWAGTGEGLVEADIQSQQILASFGSSEGLPAEDVQSLAASRGGTIYVGTTGGLAWIENSSVFQSELVQGEVQMLCVDNLSSLWASSTEALYRIRPDGSVEEYNTYNSPLQSLNIRHAACDYDQGFLYLVTDHGLWRLHLEQGMEGNLESAAVFPNPFLPAEGNGLGVAGLPDLLFDFRVFDLTGNLVYESASRNRDSFAWDGIDTEGNLVASGTYIVELVQEGSSVFIKLAVVR